MGQDRRNNTVVTSDGPDFQIQSRWYSADSIEKMFRAENIT